MTGVGINRDDPIPDVNPNVYLRGLRVFPIYQQPTNSE